MTPSSFPPGPVEPPEGEGGTSAGASELDDNVEGSLREGAAAGLPPEVPHRVERFSLLLSGGYASFCVEVPSMKLVSMALDPRILPVVPSTPFTPHFTEADHGRIVDALTPLLAKGGKDAVLSVMEAERAVRALKEQLGVERARFTAQVQAERVLGERRFLSATKQITRLRKVSQLPRKGGAGRQAKLRAELEPVRTLVHQEALALWKEGGGKWKHGSENLIRASAATEIIKAKLAESVWDAKRQVTSYMVNQVKRSIDGAPPKKRG
jgi:hypothetical protein